MVTRHCLLVPSLLAIGVAVMSAKAGAGEPRRAQWYWDSIVNLHIDNHSRLVGKGHRPEELADMLRGIPVSMIQVSAFGAVGVATYPTALCPHPGLGDWDTLATWKQVAGKLGTRFGVYINTRGLGLPKQHPEWMQRDARGKGKGRNGGLDVCARPSADGSGVLERVLLPMLNEIVTRYRPDAIWVDGDHARTPVCYCPNCAAAWKAKTGRDEPPTGPKHPAWPQWLALEQQRFDAYRERMAHAIHAAHNGCLYTSNHSWRFRARDPRSAPAFADTLSGDLSHGAALRLTRLSAMALSAEESLPCDIMHNVSRINRREASLRRILQQGALTFASGGAWFLWVPGATIVHEPMRERAKRCADFAMARRAALGRSTSLNQTAVLLSETSWHRERIAAQGEHYDAETAERAALALQDAGYPADIVNEAILRSRIARYRTVFVVNQRSVASETLAALRGFVQGGGLLVVAGSGFQGAAGLLGLARGTLLDEPQKIELADGPAVLRSVWDGRAERAEVLARSTSGKPFLSRHHVGKGSAAWLAASSVAYADDDGLLAWTMRSLGHGPAVHIEGAARDQHLVFALRQKDGRIVLHVCDLTSRVKGRRIVPASRNDIDEESPLPEVRLRLPLAAAPKAVQAVPPETKAQARWEKGILHLTLSHVDVHAAVVLDAPPQVPMSYLTTATPAAERHLIAESIDEDFESLSPRRPVPDSLGNARAGGRTSLRVTSTAAASGRRSLKFVDHPDAPRRFHPLLVLRPRGLSRDVGYVSFDLRLGAGAEVQVELREVENAREFPVGPSLWFSGKEGLRVPGRQAPLAALPVGEWARVDILCPLDGRGRYTVRLQVPGRGREVFAELPCRSPAFWRCGWVGIIGQGTSEATFFVDNLAVGRIKKIEDLDRVVKPARPAGGTIRPREEKGLVGFWRFDEGEGETALDSSGRANHGHVGAQWAKGPFGTALAFSGKPGANVMVEDGRDLRFGASSFTIECWVRPRSLESPKHFRRLIDKGGFPRTWWNVDLLRNGRVEMEMADEHARSGTTASAGSIPVGVWTHLAVVVDREQRQTRYYLNGTLDAARHIPERFTGGLDVAGKDLFIGGSHMPFVGLIDEVGIHRRALAAEEVQASYAREVHRRGEGP